MKKLLVPALLIYLFSSIQVVAQKKNDITIKFSPSFDIEKVKIYCDYGRGRHTPYYKSKINWIKLSLNHPAAFKSIELTYPNKQDTLPDHRIGFFVSSETAEIRFYKNDTSANKLGSYTLSNAWTFDEMGANKFNSFATKDNIVNWVNNKKKYNAGANYSVADISLEKKEQMINKGIEFIKNNGDLYYSFWLMRNYTRPTQEVNADSLLQIFYTAFPEDIKKSWEGHRIERYLLPPKITKCKVAPDFTSKDINDKNISLSQFQNKYIIINFWASWCRPCIAEFPAINKIRGQYSGSDLEFIFVNMDKDSSVFHKAIEKHKINYGHHIPRSKELTEKYGIVSIPKLILVSPERNVLYTEAEEPNHTLEKLNALLEELIGGGS